MKKVIALLLAMVMMVVIAAPAFASPYSDVSDNHWALHALEVLSDLGIITGYPDGTFRGQENMSRFEVAIAIYRALEYLEWNITNENNKLAEVDGRLAGLENQVAGGTIERLIIQQIEQLTPEQLSKMADDIAALNDRVSSIESNGASQADLAKALKDIEDAKAELARLQDQINALNGIKNDVKALSDKVDYISGLSSDPNLRNDLIALMGRVSALESKIANLAAIDPSINDTVAALRNDVLALSGRVSALETTSGKSDNELANTVAGLKNDLNAMSGRLALLEGKLVNVDPALAQEIKDIQAQLDQISAGDKAAAQNTEDNFLKLTNDIQVILARLSALENKMDNTAPLNEVYSALDSFKNDADAMNIKIADLESKVSSTVPASSVTQLQNDFNAMSGRLSALESKLANVTFDPSVSSDLAALKNEVAALSGRLVLIERSAGASGTTSDIDVAQLKNSVDSLSGRVASMETKLANVNADPTLAAKVAQLQNDLNAMSGRLALTETKLANVNADPTLATKVAQLQNDLNAMSGRLALTETKLANINADPTLATSVAQMKNDLLALSGRVAFLESKDSESQKVVDAFGNDIYNINVKLADIQSQLDGGKGTNSDITTLKNDVAVLANRLAALEGNLNSSSYSTDRDIATIKSQLASLETKVNLMDPATKVELADIKAQVAGIENTIAGLTIKPDGKPLTDQQLANDVAVLAGRVVALETKVSDPSLRAEVSALKDTVIALNGKVAAMDPATKSDIADVNAKIAGLQLALTQMQNSDMTKGGVSIEDITLRNDIAVLSGKLAGIESRLNAANEGVSLTNQSMAELQRTLAETNAKVNTLEAQFAAYDPQIKNLIGDLTGKVAELQTKLEYAQGINENLMAQNASDHLSFSNDIATLSSRLYALESKLNLANSTNDLQANEIAAIKNEMNAIGSDISKINLNYNALDLQSKGIVTDANVKFADLSARLDALSKEMAAKDIAFSNDIAVLSSRLYALESKLNQANSTNDLQASEIAAIKSEISAIGSDISKINLNYNALDLQSKGVVADTNVKFTDISARLDALSNELGTKDLTIANDIAVLSNQLRALDTRVGNQAVTDIQLADEIAKLKLMVKDLDAKVDGTAPGLKSTVDSLVIKVAELENKVNNGLTSSNLGNDPLIASLKAEIAALNSKLAGLPASSDMTIASDSPYSNLSTFGDVARSLEALDQKVANLEHSYSNLSESTSIVDSYNTYNYYGTISGTELDERLIAIEGRLDNLEARVTSLEGKVSFLEGTVDSILQAINDLRVEYSREFESMNVEFANLDRELAALNTRMTVLEDNMNDLYDKTARAIEPLKTQLADVEGRVDILENDVADMKNVNAALTTKTADIQNTLSTNMFTNGTIKLSGYAAIEASMYSLNITNYPQGALYVDMFNYDSTKTYISLVERFTSFSLKNVIGLTLTITPTEGVTIDLDAKLKTDLLAIGKVNGIKGSDYDINIDITAPGVVARIKGGNIASLIPSLSDYTLSKTRINKLIGNTTDFFNNTPIINSQLLSLFGASLGELHGVYGQLSLFGGTVTVDAMVSDIGWNIIDMVNIPVFGIDRSTALINNGLMFGASAVYNPIQQLSIGLNASGVYTDVDNALLPIWINNTVLSLDYKLNTGIVKSNGEFAFNQINDANRLTRDIAGKVDLTIGTEPGIVVGGYFERVGEHFRPTLANMVPYLPSFVPAYYSDKDEDSVAYDTMRTGVNLQLPSVVGIALGAKLEYEGDANWDMFKYRIETVYLNIAPNFKETTFKLSASAKRTTDLIGIPSAPFRIDYYTYAGKLDFAYKSFSADVSVVNDFRSDMFKIDSTDPYATAGLLEFGANMRLNFVKDILYIKGGMGLIYDLGYPAHMGKPVYSMYTGEIGLNLPIGTKFNLDAAFTYYNATDMSASSSTPLARLVIDPRDCYESFKLTSKLTWNITEKTSLYAGAAFESRDYQYNGMPASLNPLTFNNGRNLQSGSYLSLSAGLKYNLLKNTTLSLGFESILNKYVWPNDEITTLNVNVLTFNVNTKF